MKKIFLIVVILFPLLSGCGGKKERYSWAPTLNREAKAPYDTWLAYETLPFYFPNAKREAISKSFRYTSIDNSMMQHSDDSAALLVMIGLNYYVSDEEWEKLKLFVRAGNEVLIVCSKLDNKLEAALRVTKTPGSEELPLSRYNDGTTNKAALYLAADTGTHYGYTGRSLESGFAYERGPADSVKAVDDTVVAAGLDSYRDTEQTTDEAEPVFGTPEILGYVKGQPDFVRYSLGAGHITLHAAPLAFSNYFLLQKGNRAYLDGVWHSFPDNISQVYWNEYYKRTTEKSSLNVLFRYPATRWALIIALFTLLTYVLFGLKRRQRIIPIVHPLENASVSFVETVGRLYFNKGNHANLAAKMVQHFLEWVRSYYFIDTSKLDDAFIQQLSAKAGRSEQEVREMTSRIYNVRSGFEQVTPELLYALHNTFQSYYNNQRR